MPATPEGLEAVAAARVGLNITEYRRKRARGQKHCYLCRRWLPASDFGRDKDRYDGLTAACQAEFPASLCGYRHFPIPRTVRPVHLTVSPWVLLVALAFLVPWAAVMLEGRRSSRPLPPSAFGYVQ